MRLNVYPCAYSMFGANKGFLMNNTFVIDKKIGERLFTPDVFKKLLKQIKSVKVKK